VSKNGLILTSLVGAIPGLVMAYLMLMAFVNSAGGPTVLSKIQCVLALLIGLLLAAMPVGIFVLTGPKGEKAPAKKKEEKVEKDAEVAEQASGEVAEADAAAEETLIGDSSDLLDEDAAGVTDENLEIDEGPPDEFAVTGEVVNDDLDTDSEEFAAEVEAEDEFAAEEELEIEEAEEEAPKKGKKK
jgi:hypothetical protein